MEGEVVWIEEFLRKLQATTREARLAAPFRTGLFRTGTPRLV